MRLKLILALAAPVFSNLANGQGVIAGVEEVSMTSPEGWAMAHTLSATLNLGSPISTETQPWEVGFSGELGSIPHLSSEEQRVGFGGFKLEDLNKSPVFGRGRVHIGLPRDFGLELSWTPPIEINGGKPKGIYGIALERPLYSGKALSLSWRLFVVRGDASGDITCSNDVASAPPGSPENPFGCREASDDRIRLDHEGMEVTGSRLSNDGRWQPYLGLAYTRIHPHVFVNARVFETVDRSELDADGQVRTFTVGTLYHLSANWSWQAAVSYTPLHVRRPPGFSRQHQDFWSLRLGLHWRPGWTTF